jgi:hypothetical protein
MSIVLSFFPVLSDQLISRIGLISSEYIFKYDNEGYEHDLTVKAAEGHNSSHLQLSDEKCEWIPDNHNLKIYRNYSISTPVFLFGKNGIARNDAELGLALMWTSKSSNQRGVEVIGTFDNSPGTKDFAFKGEFYPGHLQGRITFQTVLFINKPGIGEIGESHLAKDSGIILGSLDEFTVIIEGSGSVFPIVEVKEPSQPLWWVVCDWTDPQSDLFEEENLRICLNKAHSNYKLLIAESGLSESPLLIEIVASSLHIIISKVMQSEYWEEIQRGENLEPGSIGQAIYYFLNTFNWETNSPENLALSIRKYFENSI